MNYFVYYPIQVNPFSFCYCWMLRILLSAMICSDRANDRYASYDPDGFKIYFVRDNINGVNGSEIMFSAVQNKMKQDFMLASQVVQVNSKFHV